MNRGRIGPISGLEMASVSIKSSLTFTGDSWLHLSRVGMFQDLGTSLRLDVIVRPSGLIAKTSKKMSQAEMIIFKCLLPVWTPGPRVVQHGPRALSLCSSHHSALDFINTLFNLASSQCKPKYSMELAVSASTGSGLSCACVCVCVCVWVYGHSFFWGGGWVEAPHSPGPGSFESCWLFLEGPRGSRAGPAGPWQAVWAGAWPLADTKLVASADLASPLQKQATPSLCSPGWHAAGVFLYWEVFSALAAAVARTDNLSLWNFENKSVLIGCK